MLQKKLLGLVPTSEQSMNNEEPLPTKADEANDKSSLLPYQQMALNVGANFAQSIASETFKQTVFANAAGLAALLAYLANKSPDNAAVLALGAGLFLVGVSSTLLGLMFTYVNTSRVLRKMLRSVTKGDKLALDRVDRTTGILGDILGWCGIGAFCVGAALGGYGLYIELVQRST